ncbi:hypothetical protein [Streptomyces sp. NPDC101393]|uniref:hypothetical protein n=1 Tax=Streptomyces sp. NPDC101393 TaxID=3366141 RepID=UPI0037FCEF7C
MPRSMALAKGARITGGVCCLLFFFYVVYWLVVDLSEFGPADLLGSWFGEKPFGRNQVTNPFHIGLAVVQLAACWTAFAGKRVAGGLLAVATTFTFVTVLQAMVGTGSTTDMTHFFRIPVEVDAPTFRDVFFSTLVLVPLAFLAGLVLLCGNRSWPRARPSEPPMRPTRSGGAVAGVILGALALAFAAWNLYVLVQGELSNLGFLYAGLDRGLGSLLDVTQGAFSVVLFVLCAVAALCGLTRSSAARGLAMGLAMLLLPYSLIQLIAMINAGVLFDFPEPMPGLVILGHIEVFLGVFGSVALLFLMGRGEPVAPGWQPPAQLPTYTAPGFAPPGPQGPPPAGWQQPGPPMPPHGSPMPPPPGNPPPPQGGFGPPQY